MPNERLRALLLERGVTPAKLSETVQVDPKTIERWITAGRVPYRRHRYSVSAFFGVDESYIWPGAIDQDQVAAAAKSEIVAVYPHRWSVPRETWEHFFAQAKEEIGALVYSGMFMAEDIGVHRLFAERARNGARVRILLGDPDSPEMELRGREERLYDGLTGRIRMALAYYRPLAAVEGVTFHLHRTALYNSIFRYDDQMLVNQHIYGTYCCAVPMGGTQHRDDCCGADATPGLAILEAEQR